MTNLSSAYRLDYTEKRTQDGILDVFSSGERSGAMMDQGSLNYFKLDSNDKLSIIGTPIADSDGNFYESIYGDYRTSFSSFDFSLLSGYVKNNEEKIYYLTDSQFVYNFAHLCQINVQDDFSVAGVTIQLTDDDKAEFTASFDLVS